jgi:hypothetical protein
MWFFKKYPVIGPALALVVVFMVFITIDGLFATAETHYGKIIDKDSFNEQYVEYDEEYYDDALETDTYVGEVERLTITILEGNKRYRFEVASEIFDSKFIGDSLEFIIMKGKFTKLKWDYFPIK